MKRQLEKYRRLFSLLAGTGGMALLIGASAVHAQVTIEIDNGQTVTVPGSQSSPWDLGINFLHIGVNGEGTLEIGPGGLVTNSDAVIGVETGSSGVVEVSGTDARWQSNSSLTVGENGTGSLSILNGGYVHFGFASFIGENAGSIGSVTVSGANSRLDTSIGFRIGSEGNGSLFIENGGVVTSGNGLVGQETGSTGLVVVSGSGSRWETDIQGISVGTYGDGRLLIQNGGVVTSLGAAYVGAQAGSTGYAQVSGPDSRLDVDQALIGLFGDGTLIVMDGGVVTSQIAYIGYGAGGIGIAQVSGSGSRLESSVGTAVGVVDGYGILTVSDGGSVIAPTLYFGVVATGRGMVVIGSGVDQAGNLLAASAPGIVEADAIQFTASDARLVFNHTSSGFVFDATINNGADNAAGSGTGLVSGGLIDAVAGRTIFNHDHGDFTGTLQADTGILQVNGDMSGGAASVLAGGILEGNGIVGNTVNAGVIAPGASIGVLTIAGNYTGNGGTLHIEAVLGDDASPADRLVITGDVSGHTSVVVTNLGDTGAQTTNGIRIIDIGGVSPGDAFSLRGDYITAGGQQAVIGGAYAYTLQHNSEADPADGNWYLVSELDGTDPEERPLYQPGVPLYEQYPQVLAALNTVPTLQQRVGNRYWLQYGTTQPGNAAAIHGAYGMWGRIEGSRSASGPVRSEADAHRDIDLWKLQTGFDFVLRDNADGSKLVGGVTVSHGTAFADIGSPYGRGKIDTTGTGIGATLTWYGTSGFYADAQAQIMWFDSDIMSNTEGRKVVKGNDGNGYLLSLETGNRYRLGNGFSVTPQVQLVWSQVDFSSFTDPFGAHVALSDGDSLRARLGVSLDHETGWTAADGTGSRAHIYGIANLYNEFLDGTKVAVANVPFRSRDERLWVGLGVGGSYNWNNDRYSVFGNVNISGSLRNPGDNHAFSGTAGFRVSW